MLNSNSANKMIITEDCINCGACKEECHAGAVYEPGKRFKVNRRVYFPISLDHFFIVTEFCDGCAGFKKIKCIAVCPMGAIKSK